MRPGNYLSCWIEHLPEADAMAGAIGEHPVQVVPP